jgi:hypothetical protein
MQRLTKLIVVDSASTTTPHLRLEPCWRGVTICECNSYRYRIVKEHALEQNLKEALARRRPAKRQLPKD